MDIYSTKTQLSDYISYLPKFIDSQLCDSIINLYAQSNSWKTHSWYNPKEDKFKTYKEDCSILAPIEAAELEGRPLDLIHQLMPYVNEGIKRYCQEMKVGNVIKRITLARLNRYTPDTHMSPHFDHIQSIFDGEEKGIPILSVVGNFNDSYQGGEFVFFNDNVMHLSKGDLIIFPSCFLYPHHVKHVTQGVRYSFVSWAY